MMKLESIIQLDQLSLYKLPGKGISRWLISTPETRAICNDPFVYGVEYTDRLRRATAKVLQVLREEYSFGSPEQAVVLHILRGGLNFGLRESLHRAFRWSTHTSAFISSQRVLGQQGDWYISENRYQKVQLPDNAHIIFGDVVATGVSLEHAIIEIIEIAKQQGKSIHQLTFFTIGSERALEILTKADVACRKIFPEYEGSHVIYIEGIFGVANKSGSLQIAIPGTDLLRSPAVMAPEFIESQSGAPSYALERCTIYDAGSRAFSVQEYLEDIKEYWQQVRTLAEEGVSYIEYLQERFPEDPRLNDKDFIEDHNTAEELVDIAEEQIAKCVV